MTDKNIVPELSLKQLDEMLQQTKDTTEQYSITIVTPMFGGGRDAGKIDDEQPVRTSSIRGNLRFWWRATRGVKFDNVRELKEAESTIFGDTDHPSPVKIWVSQYQHIKNEFPKARKELNYITFPFKKEKHFINQLKFTLFIKYPSNPKEELKKELEAALWAWTTFGGIGARTRRGCGSLYCSHFFSGEHSIVNNDVIGWVNKHLTRYDINLKDNYKREWPTLQKIHLKPKKTFKIMDAWIQSIKPYSDFRSRRNKTNSQVGRSHWPEADSIRLITKRSSNKHRKSITIKKDAGGIAFPRAQFGLPITFHFNNEHEPKDTTLLSVVGKEKKERLASNVIVKPLTLETENQKAIPMFVVLNQPEIEKLVLESTKNHTNISVIDKDKIYPKHVDYKKYPLKGSDNKVHQSALDALIESGYKDWCKIPKNKH